MDIKAGEEASREQWESATTEGGAPVIVKLDGFQECHYSWAPTHWDQENWLAIKMLYMYIYICNNDWLPHGYVLS